MKTGERAIDQRPNGKFRVRLMNAGKRVVKEFLTLPEAVTFRDSISLEIREGTMVAVEGQSLLDMRAPFLAARGRARDDDEDRFDFHVAKAPFAAQPVSTVTRVQVKRWLDSLRNKLTSGRGEKRKLSWQTRKHLLNLVRAAFTFAQDEGLIDVNPARDIRMEKKPTAIDDGELFLTPDEQARLLAVDHPEVTIAAFAIGTGLRQGEQWALHLRDVHVDGDQPRVVVRYGGFNRKHGGWQPPKSGKVRVVPLFGLGLVAAKRWLEIRTAYLHGPKLQHASPLMFPTERGSHRDQKPPRHGWPLMVAAVGRHVHWHLLRHTCASSLVAGWWGRRWRLEEVKEMLGHSSITVTQRYAHLASSRLFEVAEDASVLWSRLVPTDDKPAADAHGARPSKPLVAGSSPAERAAVKQGVSDGVGDPSRDNAGTTGLAGFGVWTEEGQ